MTLRSEELKKALAALGQFSDEDMPMKTMLLLGVYRNDSQACKDRQNNRGPKYSRIGPIVLYKKADVKTWLESQIVECEQLEKTIPIKQLDFFSKESVPTRPIKLDLSSLEEVFNHEFDKIDLLIQSHHQLENQIMALQKQVNYLSGFTERIMLQVVELEIEREKERTR
jgi:hypothetical protein